MGEDVAEVVGLRTSHAGRVDYRMIVPETVAKTTNNSPINVSVLNKSMFPARFENSRQQMRPMIAHA